MSSEDGAHCSIATGENVSTFSLAQYDSALGHNGPMFVVDRARAVVGVDWRWNAWGGRYQEHERDAAAGKGILEHLKMRSYEGPLVLEGGTVVTDGEGTVIVSERALLDPSRNSGLTRGDAELVLRDFLGARKVIWLADGLSWQGGPGHAETIACFARPGLVLALGSSDSSDSNYRLLQENLFLSRRRPPSAQAGRPQRVPGDAAKTAVRTTGAGYPPR